MHKQLKLYTALPSDKLAVRNGTSWHIKNHDSMKFIACHKNNEVYKNKYCFAKNIGMTSLVPRPLFSVLSNKNGKKRSGNETMA